MFFEHGWMYMGVGSDFGMFLTLNIQTYMYTHTVCRLIYLIIPKRGNSVDEISGTKTHYSIQSGHKLEITAILVGYQQSKPI